jgi:hypothetical protein
LVTIDRYIEEESPEVFFVPYIWSLAYRMRVLGFSLPRVRLFEVTLTPPPETPMTPSATTPTANPKQLTLSIDAASIVDPNSQDVAKSGELNATQNQKTGEPSTIPKSGQLSVVPKSGEPASIPKSGESSATDRSQQSTMTQNGSATPQSIAKGAPIVV